MHKRVPANKAGRLNWTRNCNIYTYTLHVRQYIMNSQPERKGTFKPHNFFFNFKTSLVIHKEKTKEINV